MPVGEPVDVSLTSHDVIHSIWVPQLNGKSDVIPGRTNHLAFTATSAGTYRGQCAEFCGIAHAKMALLVVAEAPAEYARWLADNRAPARAPATAQEVAGARLVATTACAGCHTVTGTAADGTLGPDLTHVGARQTLGRGHPRQHTCRHGPVAVSDTGREARRKDARPRPQPRPGRRHRRLPREPAVTVTVDPADARSGALVEHEASIERAWRERPGMLGFFTTVDHKRLGIRYIVTSFFFFFLAGALALVMRAQLARPNQTVVGPEAYNQLFTMHGTIMIFLFNTPVLAGFGNYLLPLMVGARDMAYPRLNAFSYWIFVGAGTFMSASMVLGKAPDGGWFAYVPLTDKSFSPGINLDFWGLGVIFVGISTTAGAVNFIVTAFKLRAPGMTVNRLPVLVWSYIAMGFMILFAVPAITVSAALLEADRLFGTRFYVPDAGGDALLYQHLFWFWGHPEVYILFLPAVGMVTTMITTFSRRPTSGYLWNVAALMGIAFISFGVWVHHMFATGLPSTAMGAFSAASFVIGLPSAVLYFSWIGTMWGGRVRFTAAMLFALGFLIIFLLGGITGVMVAAFPFDLQVTDSYFIVAHFHYVLNGAVVFPIFGAIYYWMPKMTGRLLDERLGKWSFWTMLVGFNVTFAPMHILGELGMARRMYTYDSDLGWDTLNLIISLGSLLFAAGTLLTLVNVVLDTGGPPKPARPLAGRHARVGDHLAPAGGELRLRSARAQSPSPVASPRRRQPDRRRRRGARRRRAGEVDTGHRWPRRPPGRDPRDPPSERAPCARRPGRRAVLRRAAGVGGDRARRRRRRRPGGHHGLDLEHRPRRATAAWSRTGSTTVPIGSGPVSAEAVVIAEPVLGPQARSQRTGWWGMAMLIVTEGMIFAALLSSYFYVRANSASWPQGDIRPPDLWPIGAYTGVLLASSLPLFWGEAAIRRGTGRPAARRLGAERCPRGGVPRPPGRGVHEARLLGE